MSKPDTAAGSAHTPMMQQYDSLYSCQKYTNEIAIRSSYLIFTYKKHALVSSTILLHADASHSQQSRKIASLPAHADDAASPVREGT